MTNPELAKKLDRSIDSVERKMYRLGLKKSDMADKNLPVEQQVEIDEVVKAQSKKTKVIKKNISTCWTKLTSWKKKKCCLSFERETTHYFYSS